jgi:hypothetical protein
MADIQEFLEMFNDGELEVEKYFGDYSVWFNLLKKRGLIDEIDPQNAGDSQVWQNQYLLWAYQHDKSRFYDWIEKFLSDVEFENGKAFLVTKDREDLAELFCDNRRNDISQDTLRSILSGEYDWDRYWDTTDDVVRDVVEELNEENLELFKKRLYEELKGKQLSPETSEMELIASEQGHNDFWEITPENLDRIIKDDESLNSLLDDELKDMRSDLYSIHSNAYNSAYETSVYNEIMNELSEYFEGDGTWVERPHPFKKDTKIQYFKLPIIDLNGFLIDYLDSNKNYGNSGTIEYFGSLIGLLKEDKDCLSPRVPDYPDYHLVDKHINEYFSDYF